MESKEEILRDLRQRKGKIEVISRVPMTTSEELSRYYTPGVAYASSEITGRKELVYEYTRKSNLIAIISDGTRILGLGRIGPYAGLPVMEGKSILFKKFGGVDAVPLCVSTTDEEEIVRLAAQIEPSFGAINIEDIESPKSLRIAERLSKSLAIPVIHDDQQGTAVVVLAALMNSLKLAGKGVDSKVVINGAGSAGIGIARLLIFAGFRRLYVLDSHGSVYRGRKPNMNEFKNELASATNPECETGSLEEISRGADVLIGVSRRGVFSESLIKSMNMKPIVFALANPEPEISYDAARAAGAFIAATGRSDRPNQVNNLLAFPGIGRGLLESRARTLNNEMLHSAAIAIARASSRNLSPEHILPDPMDTREAMAVAVGVSAAVCDAASKTGAARIDRDTAEVRRSVRASIKRYNYIEKRVIKRESE